ncbi:hypothetical protein HGRIS_005555 [Hohenbuehelia grisea]|uniref:Uncharacterized protein n=1 Tax=Hohenbuehelia grisea TaxID=104357 RepID=A0ABR3JZ11_9AGAR
MKFATTLFTTILLAASASIAAPAPAPEPQGLDFSDPDFFNNLFSITNNAAAQTSSSSTSTSTSSSATSSSSGAPPSFPTDINLDSLNAALDRLREELGSRFGSFPNLGGFNVPSFNFPTPTPTPTPV